MEYVTQETVPDFINLRGRKTVTEFPLAGSPPSHPQWPGFGQAWARLGARRRELNPGLPSETQQPNHWSYHHCFPDSVLAESWDEETGPGVKPRQYNGGHEHPNWCLFLQAKNPLQAQDLKSEIPELRFQYHLGHLLTSYRIFPQFALNTGILPTSQCHFKE